MENGTKEEKVERLILAMKISGIMLGTIIAGLLIVIYANASESENSFWYQLDLLREEMGIFGKYPIITTLSVFIISSLFIYRETEHIDSDDERF
ncbi:MAG TPA: hypothetical protein PLE26_00405 [Candidatus Paceibacterota bacterium]|nr:hypothetical protein [Candidatus Paceibacterota bacterium]HPX52239.1 hypothetical protein [Candidatus Paceibacterota bacterium]HQB57022.1 hypothetical protein [Candidatus Paceibacterota bacterium]